MRESYLRIGEVARRSGVSAELLRVWERRYGVLAPERSSGGFRLYSDEDVERVATMRRLVDEGIAAAEAARIIRTSPAPAAVAVAVAEPSHAPAAARGALAAAITGFDETAAHETFDRLVADVTPETALRDVVLPVLHELGALWERGELSVAQEHFGSNLLRGRLLGLARGWARGMGPAALLACPPGEQHDLGLIVFGVALHRLGWRIAFLGADTPLETLGSAAAAVRPGVVVVGATLRNEPLEAAPLADLARRYTVYLGGAATTEELAASVGARHLAADPVSAAETVAGAARP